MSIKKEIVFLPYKASMWDSLESIWKAAKEIPEYEVYVVPIPYYNKNSDGSFQKFYYEGEQYPSYVPITYYEDYLFEERHPDVIFIHNPYDDCNSVTSVHPLFFSERLRNYTNLLVYIPYFVLNEIKPKKQKQIEKMEHFCTVPGVIYADVVVVQSENIRQIYINELTKRIGEESRKYWEEKILGLGSPKFDKIISAYQEKWDIPEDWLKIIKKSDGTWKKIFLYNISVGALLKYKEKMLKKIKEVLQIFRENREEITLWWRPHPLIEETMISMEPQLLEEYQRLIEQYKQEKWGIYDDTVDFIRSIIMSNAYYGDKSSLVPLYQKTGKPILIQNIENIQDI